MLISDLVPSPEEIERWRESIVVLAVRHGVPLWRPANVPGPMCEAPDELRRCCRRLVEAIDAFASKRARKGLEGGLSTPPEPHTAAVEFWTDLRSTFGAISTAELALWLERNQINWAQRERWWTWWLFFDDVANERRRIPEEFGRTSQILTAYARALFNREIVAHLDAAEGAALGIPIDPSESQLTAFDVGLDADERASHIDVVAHLRLAASRERAYLTHRLLEISMQPDELRRLERLAEGGVRT